jgi:quinol monooxygenase YgiN
MIIIAGTVRIHLAHRAEAITRAVTVCDASEREPGCRRYQITADLVDPALFHVFELWETEEALTAHFTTEHLHEFQRHLPRLVEGPLQIQRFDVTGATTL